MADSGLGVKIKLEVDAAQGETSLKRFTAAVDAALKALGKSDTEIGILKQLAAEVAAGTKKLDELPAAYRQDVETINRIGRGAKLLDEVGINKSHAAIRAEMERVKQSFAALKQSGVLSHGELTQAADRTRTAIRAMGEQMNGAAAHGARLGDAFGRLQAAAGLLMTAVGGNALVRMADAMTLLHARLTLVEGSSRAAQERFAALTAIANRAGVDIDAVAGSYTKMAGAVRNTGGSAQDTTDLTEALALALKVSGASAEDAAGVLRQLAQSMQKGKLQGDEFVTVAESGGKVLDYLAQALGVSRGALATMAQEGQLTTTELLKLNTVLDQIRADAASLPATVGDSFARLTNAAKIYINESQNVGLAMRGLMTLVDALAEHLDTVVNVLLLLGGGLLLANLGKLAGALRTAMTALGVMAGLHPLVRTLMLALTGLTALANPLASLWQALTGGDAAPTRLAALTAAVGETRKTMESLAAVARTAAAEINGRLTTAMTAAGEAVKRLGDDYRASAAEMKAALDARLAAIETNLARQLAALDNAGLSEVQLIRQSTQARIDAERDKIAAVEAAARQMEAAWRKTYGTALAAARQLGQDTAGIERQATAERIAILSTLEAAYRSTVDKLIAEEQRHLAEVRRVGRERETFNLGVEDRIRALRQRAMDDVAAYADKQRQIDEKQSAARQALAAGDFERAKRLAEDAMRIAEATAGAVTRTVEQNGKQVTQTVISEAQASGKAIGEIEESAKIVNQAMVGMEGAHRSAAGAAKSAADEQVHALEAIGRELGQLREAAQRQNAIKLDADIDAVKDRLTEVAALVAAQQLMAKIDADMQPLNDALKALQADPENRQLALQVALLTGQVDTDIAALQAHVKASRLELPALANFDQPRDGLRKFLGELQALDRVATVSAHTVRPETGEVDAALRRLQQPTSSWHTVYVKTVQTNAAGGLIAPLPRFAAGGQAFRRAAGRVTGPGTGTSDSIPSLLSAGEFVVRAASVRKYGAALLYAINRGILPTDALPRFAAGGLAGAKVGAGGMAGPAGAPAVGSRDVVDINLDIGGRKIAVQGARDQAKALAAALRELSRGA